jgi:GxxExxY protein
MKIKKGKKIVYKCIYEVMQNMPKFAQEHCFQSALDWELKQHNLNFTIEKKIKIEYKGEVFVGFFRPDIVVEFKDSNLVLELKRGKEKADDECQLESYMTVSGHKDKGILVNFNEETIKEYDSKSQTFLIKYWNDFEKTFSQEFTKGHTADSEILKEIENLQNKDSEPQNVWIQAKDLYGLISDCSDVTIRKRLAKLKEMGKLIHKDKGYQLKEKNLECY